MPPAYHRQPTIKGKQRYRLSAYIVGEIEDRIVDIANRYHVRPSWVAATIFADALHVKGHRPYTEAGRNRNGRRRDR